jgi:hypothetical protein
VANIRICNVFRHFYWLYWVQANRKQRFAFKLLSFVNLKSFPKSIILVWLKIGSCFLETELGIPSNHYAHCDEWLTHCKQNQSFALGN